MRESSELRMLVIEYTAEKMQGICERLGSYYSAQSSLRLRISTATCFSSAQAKFQADFFDVIILDLKIPVVDGGSARVEHSKDFYDLVRKSSGAKPFYILGLTSVSAEEIAGSFSESGNFTIHRYDNGDEWLKAIAAQIDFVMAAKVGLAKHLRSSPGMDALIVTARKENEFDPILSTISWVGGFSRRNPELGGMHNRFGRVVLGGKELTVGIVCLDEMGLSHSAAVVSSLIDLFRPQYIAMLGMCCGLKKNLNPDKAADRSTSKLGDVIVASETSCWDEGKYQDSDPALLASPLFYNRAVNKHPDTEFWRDVDRVLDDQESSIESEIRAFYKSRDLIDIQNRLQGVVFSPEAVIHRWPMVSGPCVVDSDNLIDEIEKRFPRAYGLEMEAHGVYTAVDCCFGLKPKALVIKGIADFGDGTKAKTVQPIASIASYMVFRRILDCLILKYVEAPRVLIESA